MSGQRSLRSIINTMAEARQLQAFRRTHPEAELSHPHGKAQLYFPYGSGGITVTRDTAGEAMDAAETMLAADPDPGGETGT